MKVESRDNTVDAEKHRILGQSVVMDEGDILRAETVDLSTGGVVDYQATAKITEFDAYLYRDPQKTVPLPAGPSVQEPKKEPGLVEWVKGLFESDPVM